MDGETDWALATGEDPSSGSHSIARRMGAGHRRDPAPEINGHADGDRGENRRRADGRDRSLRQAGRQRYGSERHGDHPAESHSVRRRPGAMTRRQSLIAAGIDLLARWSPYVETELTGLSEVVGRGAVCVDVGSAAGVYTAALCELVGATGRVHSVEPLDFAHPVWTRVLNTRAAPNVQHHAVALGTTPGNATMIVPLGRYGPVTGRSFLAEKAGSLGSNVEFGSHIRVTTEATTLDAMCTGFARLDFIKIDVEGAELDVLRGGHQVIDALRPTLLVEIEARHLTRYTQTPADVIEWLAGRGYMMFIWDHGWQPATSVCNHTRNYLFRQP